MFAIAILLLYDFWWLMSQDLDIEMTFVYRTEILLLGAKKKKKPFEYMFYGCFLILLLDVQSGSHYASFGDCTDRENFCSSYS